MVSLGARLDTSWPLSWNRELGTRQQFRAIASSEIPVTMQPAGSQVSKYITRETRMWGLRSLGNLHRGRGEDTRRGHSLSPQAPDTGSAFYVTPVPTLGPWGYSPKATVWSPVQSCSYLEKSSKERNSLGSYQKFRIFNQFFGEVLQARHRHRKTFSWLENCVEHRLSLPGIRDKNRLSVSSTEYRERGQKREEGL